MSFFNAYNMMLRGYKIRRRGWKGYWFIDKITGLLVIHLASGQELHDGEFTSLTVQNTLAYDWETIEEENAVSPDVPQN